MGSSSGARIAERVLGHAQERIRATYDTHAYLDEKRTGLERWSEHLAGLMAQAPSKQHFWHRSSQGRTPIAGLQGTAECIYYGYTLMGEAGHVTSDP